MQALPLIAVVRVKSDNHKDEIACITLAPGTLHEEKSFFAVVNTREKSFRRENVERDLQTISLLLTDRVWFGFDIELVEKTLKRLFESINQPPPQSLALWEAFNSFESTFSWSSDSVSYVAQYLQISPWTQRISNARTECDITYEVLSRIALSCALRQWTTPNQDYTTTDFQKPVEEPTNESQEILATLNKVTEDQSLVHPQVTNVTSSSARETIPSQQDLGHTFRNNNIDTNAPESIVDEVDVNTAKDIRPRDFIENNVHTTQEQYIQGDSFVDTSSHDQKVDFHNTSLDDESKGDQDYDYGHNVDYKSSENKSTAIDNSQTHYDNHRSQVGGGQASWKDLAKGKQSTSSPARPSHLHVVAGIRKRNDDQGRFKSIRDPQLIKQHINNAMASNKVIWISYDGGLQPLAPRGVAPIKWENPGSETVFLGIPYRSKTSKESKFYLRDVKEIREKNWARQEEGKPNRFGNKRKNGQGKERPNNLKSDANTTTNNAATHDTKPKQKQRQPRDNKKSANSASGLPGKSTQQTK